MVSYEAVQVGRHGKTWSIVVEAHRLNTHQIEPLNWI
jgi:hypothetical protein